jgi:drug/metabolite transporter (DMT)-like permease
VIAKFLKQEKIAIASKWRALIGVVLLQGAAYASYILALSMGPVAYVNAVKSGSILIGALAGIIFLHEKLTRTKIIAFVLLALGLGILAISK